MAKKRLTEIEESDSIAIAYVSLAVPNTPEFRNDALHIGGNIFMHNVLFGLRADPCTEAVAFSAIPVPSFPRGRRFIVPRQQLEIAPGVTAVGVSFINFTPLKQLSMGLSMLWHLIRWGVRERNKKHRVVFSFNIYTPPLAFTLVAARLLRAKTMVYICDLNTPDRTVRRSLLYRLNGLQSLLLRYVDGCIVITDRIATDWLPGCPYIRVDGGVSQSLIEETGRWLAARRLDGSHFTIVATGSLAPHNGIREILGAFSQLKGSRYRLILAGRGPLKGEIVVAAERDPRIEFKGFLETQDLFALHATADVLVSMRVTKMVDTAYGFPSKTFEYLLSGVPVITTATGHMKSEYGPYCFIVEEESAETLAGMFRTIDSMAPAARRRMGLAARRFMVEGKTWEVQHERIAKYVRSRTIRD